MGAFGLWPGCFRSVLLRLVIPTGATAEAGEFLRLVSPFTSFTLGFIFVHERAHHIFAVRHPYDSANLQRFGVPGHD